MSGTSKPSSLSGRLGQKLERDRREIERVTERELRRLGENLQGTASAVLSNIESSMRRQAEEVRAGLRGPWRGIEQEAETLGKHLRRRWLIPLAVGLSLSTGISIGLWGVLWWLSEEVELQLHESTVLESRIWEQTKTLERLEGETWGVYLHETDDGDRFVVLPKGTRLNTDWTIGGRPSVQFSSR
ncbi:MAG: hypothetical protein OXQ32_03095 [bacterium]|nr:hypothetical protein [bacterium]